MKGEKNGDIPGNVVRPRAREILVGFFEKEKREIGPSVARKFVTPLRPGGSTDTRALITQVASSNPDKSAILFFFQQ